MTVLWAQKTPTHSAAMGRRKIFFRKLLAEDVDEDTSSNGRADHAGHVGAHGVHQQEVGGVLALTDLLGDTSGHRHGGNTSGTDQGVHLTAGQLVHDLAAQHTGCGAGGEGKSTDPGTIRCGG